MAALLLSLDGRHLVIQGPPGSGKTWTSGRLIARLLAAGKTVGVASTSHRAIHKLLAEVEAGAAELGLAFRGVKKASGGNPESEYAGTQVENVYENEDDRGRGAARRHRLALLRPRARRAARLPVHRRGRPGLARRRAARWRPARATSCSSATRSSSARCCRARTRTAPRRRCSSTCSTGRRRSRPTAASSSSAPSGCTPTSATTSRRSSTRAGCSPTRSPRRGRRRSAPACATCPSSTRAAARSRRRRPRRCAPRSRACVAAGVRPDEIKVVAAFNAQVQRLRGCAAGRGRGRHGRQVPGPGGARRLLLDGLLERRGHPPRPRLPALAQPLQRRRSRARSASPTSSAHRGCSRSTAGRSSTCASRTRSAASSSWPADRDQSSSSPMRNPSSYHAGRSRRG